MSKIITASKLNRLWKNGVLPIKNKVDDLEENGSNTVVNKLSSYYDVMVNTVEGYIPDALAVKEGFGRLGGLRFGTDGDGNYGYYGADGSLIPFSQGCKLLWADYEVTSQEKGTFINVDLSRYSKVLISLEYLKDNTTHYTRYLLDVGGTYKIWGVNDGGASNYRTLTISTSGISIDAFTSVNRSILTEIYGWAGSETNNNFVYSGDFLSVVYANKTYTFDTSLVGDSCMISIVNYNATSNASASALASYEGCSTELIYNSYTNGYSIYVYKVTNIVEGASVTCSGPRHIITFK